MYSQFWENVLLHVLHVFRIKCMSSKTVSSLSWQASKHLLSTCLAHAHHMLSTCLAHACLLDCLDRQLTVYFNSKENNIFPELRAHATFRVTC